MRHNLRWPGAACRGDGYLIPESRITGRYLTANLLVLSSAKDFRQAGGSIRVPTRLRTQINAFGRRPPSWPSYRHAAKGPSPGDRGKYDI